MTPGLAAIFTRILAAANIKETLDGIPLAIEHEIAFALILAIGLGRDNGSHSVVHELVDERISVIRLIDPYAARLLGQHGIALTPDLFALRTDNDLAQLAAIRAGFGIGVCQVGIARREPDFVQLVPDGFGFDLEVWVAMHEDLRLTRRIRLMFAHLATELSVASSQRSHAST